jgi:hypothetical protein
LGYRNEHELPSGSRSEIGGGIGAIEIRRPNTQDHRIGNVDAAAE